MSSLPTVGTIFYNGFVFSEAAFTKTATVHPVKSADGRTISHAEIVLEIEDLIASTIDAETISTNALQLLTAPAGSFIYNGRGTNPLSINLGLGLPTDVKWGPFPTMLEWKPLGGGNAVKFTWRVEVAIPVCKGATYLGNQQPMEFAFRLEYNIDHGGYTTRRYAGFVEIPMTRTSQTDRVPYTSADEWRESINPPMLQGFRRVPGKFSLSEDRRRLDFEIIDEQLKSPNALPVGCTEAEASHTYSQAPWKEQYWNATVSTTYELAAGLPVGVAETAFAAVMKDRLNNARANLPAAAIWLIQFTVAETKIYDKPTVHLICSYIVVKADFAGILASGGLFRPIPGSNAKLWAASVQKILGPRGISQLKFDPSKDAILDLCVDQNGLTPPSDSAGLILSPGNGGGNAALAVSAISALFPAPSPGNSWIGYECWLSVEEDSGVVVGSTLPPTPLVQGANSGAWQPLASSKLPVKGLESTIFPQAADIGIGQQGSQNVLPPNTTFTQQRAAPIVYITLHGWALRGGYQVPIPQLLSIGGQAATPCGQAGTGEGFEQSQYGNMNGVPLYFARWRLRYVLTATPTGPFPVPGNTFFTNPGPF